MVEDAELRARAIEICRFPWSDDHADKDPRRARGRIAQSKLHEWGTDTWQVCVTRKRSASTGESRYTCFVRTHVGSKVIIRRDRSKLTVWDWNPHYWRVFDTEDEALDWMGRLSDAFARERVGDLDEQRWPQDLVDDRSEAAARAKAVAELWRRRNKEGWVVSKLDAPGQIPFVPGEAATWDPSVLADHVGGSDDIDDQYASYLASMD